MDEASIGASVEASVMRPPGNPRTTLDALAGATYGRRLPPLRPHPHGRNPLGPQLDAHAVPEAGRTVTRHDFGSVQVPTFGLDEIERQGIDILHFYNAPASTLTLRAPAPNPVLTGAFAPQTSAVRAAVRSRLYERANAVPRGDERELAPVNLASAMAYVREKRPETGPLPVPVAPPSGVREAGVCWPAASSYPPARAEIARRRPWWMGTEGAAPAVHPAMLALLCDPASERLPPATQALAVAAHKVTTLRLNGFGGTTLSASGLHERFANLEELWVVDAAKLTTLGDLPAHLPKLRRLTLIHCPRLAALGCGPATFVQRIELSLVSRCPNFVAVEEAVRTAAAARAPG